MIQRIVPTIFAENIETLKKKFSLLYFSPLIHLDICDSKFVKTQTIYLRDCLTFKNKNQKIEVHLMVNNPLLYLNDCVKLGVIRVFIQREIFSSIEDFDEIKKQYNHKNIEVALVLNPETQVEDALMFLSRVRHTMIMSVVPGAEGQIFISNVLEKVRNIRIVLPEMTLQIDGGINFETGDLSLKSGVDVLSVGSFISSSKTPKKNYDKLMKLK
jgi:ribulose-phosphate 3-epimerase